MPWHVAQSDQCPASKPWAVIKDSNGSIESCNETKEAAEAHMAALYASEDRSVQVFSHPARLHLMDGARQADLLALAKSRHAFDSRVFDEHPPFFWEAEISNDQLDSHFTHMSASTLANYAAEAEAGVAFLRGHNWRELPLGRSLFGNLEEGPRRRVLAGFYTISGLPDTDDLIRRMRSGLLTDVSVGFYGGRMVCDVCGRDYFDWDCPHIPGIKYEAKEGDVVRQVLATFTVDGAHLAEVSGVFDGSTPNAVILKAEAEAEAGRLRPEAARVLEARYRIKLPSARHVWAGASLPPAGQEQEKEMQERVMQEDDVKRVQAVLNRLGIDGSDLAAAVEALGQKLDEAQARIAELAPRAADGDQYRSDLMAEALAEGVRAYGEAFDQPTYAAMLKDAPLHVIRRMKEDWQAVGDARFPGGRQSADGDPAPDENGRVVELRAPASQFK